MAPINDLLDYHRRHGLPPEIYDATTAHFLDRLADPERLPETGELYRLIHTVDTPVERLGEIHKHLLRRVASNPEELRTLVLLHELSFRQARWADAADSLEKLYRLTRDPIHLFPLISLYKSLERWQAIADLLANQLESSEDLRIRYIEALSHLGEAEKCLEQVDRLLSNQGAVSELPGWYSEIVERTAWKLYDGGHEAAAERLFRRALELEPEAVHFRETLLYLFADPEEQRLHQERLAEQWQGESHPHGLYDEGALPLLRRAVHGLPKLEAAWYNLGMAAYRVEDWETVDRAFAHAAELQPEREASFFFRGIALGKLERCEESVEALKQAETLDPERALTYYYLYFCLDRLGRSDEAKEAYERYETLK
jgi:tetratricopeptide (TPR) repeat protein